MARMQIEGIRKSYQSGVPVLQPIDLEVRDGELFFLLGPSGCGKSTLLRIIAGLVKPDAGRILIDGRDITALPPEKRHTTMVFQNYALWPHMTVRENVAFGLQAEKKAKAETRRAVEEALELVQLVDCAERKVPTLSGGQQQRVALARALAVDPAVLLLDEPLSNLDARLRDHMRREITRICRLRKLTAIYVTHDRQEALSMADRLAVLHEGTLQQAGSPEEVYLRPVNRFVGGFLGEINLLEGTLTPEGHLHSALGEFPLSRTRDSLSAAGTTITAAVRPERLHFIEPGMENNHPHRFFARIKSRSFLGERCEWRCEAGGQEWLVTEYAAPERAIGQECVLAFEPGHLVALKG